MGKVRQMVHPCKCTSYNGKQCYNCLNGAHDICDGRPKCKKKRGKIGMRIVTSPPPQEPT